MVKKRNMKKQLIIAGMAVVLLSCGQNNKGAKGTGDENAGANITPKEEAAVTPKLNADSLVKLIDDERARIEDNLKSMQRKTLPTKDLRAQIKQKWSKIDFYTENGQVVRIKSYPYEKISQRTEEFYFQKGKLILAFIEDEGLKSKGKAKDRFGKSYYYYGDEQIKEDNPTSEKEMTIRHSDSERLLQEAREYLDLFPVR